MNWLRMHPYASGLFAAAVLLVAGALVVHGRTSVAPSSLETDAWGGGTLVNPLSSNDASQIPATGTQESIMQQVQSGPPFSYTPPQTSLGVETSSDQKNSFDLNAFLTQLEQETSPSATGSAATQGTAGLQSAYAFIPGGLVATSSPDQNKSPEQDALYQYGNEAGSYIQSFETQNPNEAQVLKDQAADRNNADKAAAVEKLGASLTQVGKNLLNIQDVPQSATPSNNALGKSYEDIGADLALVPQAQSDSDFVSAIEAYDASADTFTKNYVALANLFVAYGVTFAPSDPGSVFTFTPMSL